MPLGNIDPMVVLKSSGVPLEPLGKCSEEILHQNALKRKPIPNHHAIWLHNDGLLLLENERVSNRAIVIENRPGEQIGTNGLYNLRIEGSAHSIPLGSEEMRMALQHKAFH